MTNALIFPVCNAKKTPMHISLYIIFLLFNIRSNIICIVACKRTIIEKVMVKKTKHTLVQEKENLQPLFITFIITRDTTICIICLKQKKHIILIYIFLFHQAMPINIICLFY